MLDKTKLFGDELCKGKNDRESGGIIYGLSVAPKKFCFTIDDYGIIQEYKTFTGFIDNERLLYRFQNFKMIACKKLSALLPKS